MEPELPHLSPTSLEARHWGATYALYRVRASMFVYLSRTEFPEPINFISSAMAFNSILFFLQVLEITGMNWQSNIRTRRRT